MDFRQLSENEEKNLQNIASKAFFMGRSLISHQLDSFNDFTDHICQFFADIPVWEVEPDHLPGSDRTETGLPKHGRITFGNINLKKPGIMLDQDGKEDGRPILPSEARLRNLTYAAKLYADVQLQVYTKNPTNENMKTAMKKETILENEHFKNILLGEIPIMVKSKFCNLSDMQPEDMNSNALWKRGDCCFDMGGYFIIKGAEKVMIAQEERFLQRVWVSDKGEWRATFSSPPKGLQKYASTTSVKLVQTKSEPPIMCVDIRGVGLIPISIIFCALGIDTDRHLLEAITSNLEDNLLLDLVRPTLKKGADDMVHFVSEKYPSEDPLSSIHSSHVALQFIGSRITNRTTGPVEAARDLLETRLLPHMEGSLRKALFLGHMVHCLCQCYLKRHGLEDKDNYRNKRLDLPGTLFSYQLRQLMERFQREICKNLQKKISKGKKVITGSEVVDPKIVTIGFNRAFTQNWVTRNRAGSNNTGVVTATLFRTNPMATVCHLRTTRTQIAYAGRIVDAHYPNISQYGRVCAVDTPDGENCGLVKSMAVFAIVTLETPEQPILNALLGHMKPPEAVFPLGDLVKVFLNGKWVGITDDENDLEQYVKRKRRGGELDYQVEVCLRGKEINIFSDAGRLLRPLFIVDKDELCITKEHLFELRRKKPQEGFDYLVNEGVIEFIGAEEEYRASIAGSIQDLKKPRSQHVQYTHMELHPASLLAIGAFVIPFVNHNQSSRVMQQSRKHCRQAIGFNCSNLRVRCDTTSHELLYPQRPLVRTQAMTLIGRPELHNGQNPIVAVLSDTGYNQEDSIILNQSSLDRGMFRSMHFHTHKDSLKLSLDQRFGKPSESDVGGYRKQSHYEKLDSDGLPFIGASLSSSDVIIGKLSTVGADVRETDASQKLKHTERGRVDQVVITTNNDAETVVKVRLRECRTPQVGDKFSSMHGQKGVVGMCFHQEDLPFTRDGIVPDLIINPHAFPTRQTLGQLMECLAGKAAAVCGQEQDATPFVERSLPRFSEELHKQGFQRAGMECMYSGRMGTRMKVGVNIGVTFYQRLSHMAEDKMKYRRTGSVHPLTRQPIVDRKRHGGIRFGEMERDCMIAHGASATLQERLFLLSDPYVMYICTKCRRTASVEQNKVPRCRFCKCGSNIVRVNIPYACKLLKQELNSMGMELLFDCEPC